MGRMDQVQQKLAQLIDKGWTKSSIARALGVGYVAVYRWGNGSQRPANIQGTVLQLNALLRHKEIPKQKVYDNKNP